MAKYICLENELDKSKYDQLKAMDEGFEIVLFRSHLKHEYPEYIEHTELYNVFEKICGSMRQSGVSESYNNMSFRYVYDVGQINDVFLAIVLSDIKIDLTIDISIQGLEKINQIIKELSYKCRSLYKIKEAINETIDQIDCYSDNISNDISFIRLRNALGCGEKIENLNNKYHKKIHDTFMKYKHTPTA